MVAPSLAERANVFHEQAQHMLKLAAREPVIDGRAALFLCMAHGYHQMAKQVQSGAKFKL